MKIPQTLDKLARAIALLGSRTKVELTKKPRAELEELIGFYPSAERALEIKSELKKELKLLRERSE